MIQEGDMVKLKTTGSNRIKWEYGRVTRIFNDPSMAGEAWVTTIEGYKIIEYLDNLEKI